MVSDELRREMLCAWYCEYDLNKFLDLLEKDVELKKKFANMLVDTIRDEFLRSHLKDFVASGFTGIKGLAYSFSLDRLEEYIDRLLNVTEDEKGWYMDCEPCDFG